MRRMVHCGSDGFIKGPTTIYEEGEDPGVGETLATIIYGVVAIGAIWYIYKMFEPFFG